MTTTQLKPHVLTLTDRAYAQIKEAILSLDLLPGQSLIESQLAKNLEISKTPVREALQRLSTEGLVVLDRFRGASVRAVTADWVSDVYAVRELLEPVAVLEAVPLLTAGDVRRMEDALEESARALRDSDLVALGTSNRLFHGLFLERVHNRFLREVLSGIQNQLRVISIVTWMALDSRTQEHEEHLEILEAARSGDARRASRLMKAHIYHFKETALRALARRGGNGNGLGRA